ncbi:MAG: PQQ-binding-like beta-propeller repeat protein [Myxococcota bacterium]|nr:PQQ-binding-like beta-propeller repeat protein [Myxococcota bacterium]
MNLTVAAITLFLAAPDPTPNPTLISLRDQSKTTFSQEQETAACIVKTSLLNEFRRNGGYDVLPLDKTPPDKSQKTITLSVELGSDGAWTVTYPKSDETYTLFLQPNRAIGPQLRPLRAHFGLKPEVSGYPFNFNDQAMAFLCRGQKKKALQTTGSAFHEAFLHVENLELSASQTGLFKSWLQGKGQLIKKEYQQAEKRLRSVSKRLQRGEWMPDWRIGNSENFSASFVQFIDEHLIVFNQGKFMSLNPRSGEMKWRFSLPKGLSKLVKLDPGTLLAISTQKLTGLDLEKGIPRWSVPLSHPLDEVVVKRGILYAANKDSLVSVNIETGRVIWKKGSPKRIIAGPALFEDYVVVPQRNHLSFYTSHDGQLKHRIAMPDEVSGPLFSLNKNALWALIGGSQMGLIRSEPVFSTRSAETMTTPQLTATISGALAVAWPPKKFGDSIVFSAEHIKRGPFVSQVNISGKKPAQIRHWRSSGPVHLLDSFQGFISLSRNRRSLAAKSHQGKKLWRKKFRSPVETFHAHHDLVWVAADRIAFALDQLSGKTVLKIQFDEPIVELKTSRSQGVVVSKSGTLYGFNTAPSKTQRSILSRVQTDLVQSYLGSNQVRKAKKLIRAMDRDPKNPSFARFWNPLLDPKWYPKSGQEVPFHPSSLRSRPFYQRLLRSTGASRLMTLTSSIPDQMFLANILRDTIKQAPIPQSKNLKTQAIRAAYPKEKLLAAGSEFIVLAATTSTLSDTSSKSTRIRVFDHQTGKQLWQRSYKMQLSEAAVAKDGILFFGPNDIISTSTASGIKRYKSSSPGGDKLYVSSYRTSWLLAAGKRVMLLNKKTGTLNKTYSLGAKIKAFSHSNGSNTAFIIDTESNLHLLSLNSDRKKTYKRVPFSRLYSGHGATVAFRPGASSAFILEPNDQK